MLLTSNLNSTNYLEIKKPELLHSYGKGEEIPLLEPGFWQVYRGVAQLSRINSSGDEIILGWVSANNSFGYCAQNDYHYQAKALSNTYLRWCSPLDIAKSPELGRILMAQLSQRLIKAEQLLTITGLRKVEERLWQLLLMLKQEIGQSVVDGTRLTIRFTHQHLASIICTTRVTVTRVLGDLQVRGLISIDGDRHIIVREN